MTRAGRLIFQAILALASLVAPVALQAEDESAVILLYHRFGEDDYPTTNIRLEQIDAQIAQLKSGGYHFLRLGDITAKLKAKEHLPEQTVAVTVDDAYKSVVLEGWPRLKAAGIPMTLFVSTDAVDNASGQASSNYMTWDDVRALKADGVEIAHHTASHLHMPHAGLEASLADVRRASARFEAELGMVPSLFAYPYGEYTLEIKNAIEAEGFNAAFAQYSGAAATWSDPFAFPRFPVNERYGDASRFKLISQAMALPVSDVVPLEVTIADDRNPPVYGFTVDDTVRGLSALACYPSHLGQPAELIRPTSTRIEVRFEKPFPKGRNRINCTLPAGGGRWYWHGQFFLVPGGVLD